MTSLPNQDVITNPSAVSKIFWHWLPQQGTTTRPVKRLATSRALPVIRVKIDVIEVNLWAIDRQMRAKRAIAPVHISHRRLLICMRQSNNAFRASVTGMRCDIFQQLAVF